MENAKKCIEEALDSMNICRESRKIKLKEERERVVKELILGNDVLATLPTGFGKSMVYRPLHDLYPGEPNMRSAVLQEAIRLCFSCNI